MILWAEIQINQWHLEASTCSGPLARENLSDQVAESHRWFMLQSWSVKEEMQDFSANHKPEQKQFKTIVPQSTSLFHCLLSSLRNRFIMHWGGLVVQWFPYFAMKIYTVYLYLRWKIDKTHLVWNSNQHKWVSGPNMQVICLNGVLSTFGW